MPRRSRSSNSGERVSQRFARRLRTSAPPVSTFDERWLNNIRDHTRSRYIDLTRHEDRRFWSPSTVEKYSKRPQRTGTLGRQRPRIVIVPQGHRLARFQTYNGRYTLADIQHGSWRGYSSSTWHRSDERYSNDYPQALRYDDITHRVGYHAPWQVIVCVRRKRRTEVLHALGKTGNTAAIRIRRRRNDNSEVRC